MYLITNRALCTESKYLNTIVDAAKTGVKYLILREKDLDYSELESLYKKIISKLEKNSSSINIIINSSIEIYENYPVYGIHLPYHLFKKLMSENYKFDKNKKIGLSLHSVEEVAELENIIKDSDIQIDYITLSHIYITKCKEGLAPRGINLLQESRKITDLKIVALGGILPTNVNEVINYCDDIAVMSTIFNSDNPIQTILSYESEIKAKEL